MPGAEKHRPAMESRSPQVRQPIRSRIRPSRVPASPLSRMKSL
ncbi:MAG: hypothetical protein J6C41_02320 [Oscillospiraceae bacterium]|nr:hypothetical protein [Oscillospiraceae bacterium]